MVKRVLASVALAAWYGAVGVHVQAGAELEFVRRCAGYRSGFDVYPAARLIGALGWPLVVVVNSLPRDPLPCEHFEPPAPAAGVAA